MYYIPVISRIHKITKVQEYIVLKGIKLRKPSIIFKYLKVRSKD